MRAAHGPLLSLAHSWGAAAIARRLGIHTSAPTCGPDQLTWSWWAAGLGIEENLPDDQAVLAAYRDHFGIDRIEELGERLDSVASSGDHTFTVAQHDASPLTPKPPTPWREPLVIRSARDLRPVAMT
jgi:hypothetical protein